MIYQADVADIAEAAAFARQAGAMTHVAGGTFFHLNVPDYCARFVRQCHEAAMGLAPWRWEFSSPDALTMEENLRLARREVKGAPDRGDILFFNRNSGQYGHVGIFLGGGMVAEGTSSSSRGDPRAAGVKITRIEDIGEWRVTSCCRTLPATPGSETDWNLTAEKMLGGELVPATRTIRYELRAGELWVPIGDLEGLYLEIDRSEVAKKKITLRPLGVG